MTQLGVLWRDGSYHCYSTEDAIKRVEFGCSHRMPRSAIDHSNKLSDAARSRSSDLADLGTASEPDGRLRSGPERTRLPGGVPAPAPIPLGAGAPDLGL